ncbi:MAG: alpha/beta fold hydrolase [Bryobacterales bacterium]
MRASNPLGTLSGWAAWAALAALVAAAWAADAPFYADKQDLLVYLEAGESKPVRNSQDWERRRRHIVANMESVMGPFPASERPPLDVRVIEGVALDGYTRKSITYAAREPEDRVPAYLLIPEHPNGAGILALHPTGELGKGIAVGLGDRPNRGYAHELARRGYVVLAPDYPYMGDAQTDPYALGYVSGTMKGIYNHSRGVDLLLSLPQVQVGRIGAIGHSLGGHNALFAGIFEPRVRAIVTSCGFNAFPKYKGGDLTGWSSDKYMPRIASLYGKDPRRMPFDFTEVLAALAPRAVFISGPTGDDNFEVSGVRDCVRSAVPVYEMFDAAKNLVAVHPDCGHDFPPEIREQAYRFLDESLL